MCAEHSLGLQHQQKQEMQLTYQQRQSLEVLAAPLMELQARLVQELQHNPMLEMEGSGIELAVGDPIGNQLASEDRAAMQDVDAEERDYEQLMSEDRWLDSLPIQHSDSSEQADRANRREFMLSSLTTETSAQESLLEQLRFLDLSDRMQDICEYVVGNLDGRGYLLATDKEIANGAECSELEAEQAVKVVQSLEPAGLAGRSLEECLLLQLHRQGVEDEHILALASNHLEEIAHNQLPQLAKKLNIAMEELKADIEVLKSLNPRPGALLDNRVEPIIVPEFTVRKVGDTLVITDTPGVIPQLKISTDYDAILEDIDSSKEARKYLTERKGAAEQLIRSLSMRQNTLKRITELLVSAQYDFFTKNVETLHPLTMGQLADKLDLHETTVSRAIAGKYIGTPHGVYEYKHFFSGGYTSTDGEAVSSGGIKEKIRRIIMDENPKKPLSDDKIAQQLKAEGLNVARRTVAKYREELNILPSHLRKEF